MVPLINNRLVQQTLPFQEVFFTDFTPVMGAHAGPGMVGLGYYWK